ncbi:uncharacterized protein LOC126847327 [Adelges cooleyi]|uniref:uncharacterized protein LOC126847327 n=1 Tax=Adelges cooleyi TaxID=133065 RepID=UPI00218049E6|nr:uncharacterized protein LOC126847327 [Adelges cooleyi]
MAIWGKIGGWKDNAYVYSSKNGCSTLKFFMGHSWAAYMTNLNLSATQQCPVSKGEYVMKGFDVNELQNTNLPKQFFYGSYKFRLYYTDYTGKIIGCLIVIVDVVRPWEHDVK